MLISEIGALTLAYVGDAVFELKMRTHFLNHIDTVKNVNATAQSRAADRIQNLLNEDELAVFKRGRNAKVNSIPAHSSVAEYHKATGLEALFGYLYLSGQTDRIDELFNLILYD